MPFRFRSDADVVKDIPDTRRIMPFLMPTRNEALVFFDLDVDAAPIDAEIARLRARGLHATVLHVLMHAAVQVLHERPRLNRFVAGGRLWQRRGIWVSFSAKKAHDDAAAVFVLKRRMEPGQPIEELVRAIGDDVAHGRSDARSATDKELAFFLALPVFLLSMLVALLKRADAWGLLPRFFVDGDPMFASIFFANLGSIGMDAPRHHLYEYGNIPLFCAVGSARDVSIVVDGAPVVRRIYPLRFTFDERIEDGFYCLQTLRRLQQRLSGAA